MVEKGQHLVRGLHRGGLMLVTRSAQPLLTSAAYITSNGFARGFPSSFGKLTRDPQSVRDQGTFVVAIYDQGTSGDIYFILSNDQRTWAAGKTLTIGGASYAINSASSESYNAGNLLTTWRWASGTPLAVGQVYEVGFS